MGAAHIGVIEEIERAGIKIDYICGSSAGSIIGGVYASGGLENLQNFYSEIITKKGFSQGTRFQIANPSKFFSELNETLRKYVFEAGSSFKIPFSTVATNMLTGEGEILDKGSMSRNIIASSAYPGVFPLQQINDRLYADGGITINLPAETVSKECDFTIGSSIYTVPRVSSGYFKKNYRAKALTRSLEIIEKQLSVYQENYCDFCFKPQIDNLKWYHFWKIEDAKIAGQQNAKKEIAGLLEKLKS